MSGVLNDKLPPGTTCVVCNDVATGNHYSVPSCNGCKTFFRRAIVNNRNFACMGNGKCIVDKVVRCACRACRLEKCIKMGMDTNAIQSERDRIGYTKRKRRDKNEQPNKDASTEENEKLENHPDNEFDVSDEEDISFHGSTDLQNGSHLSTIRANNKTSNSFDGILERLTQLENNFTLLLSRGEIHPYGTLEEALKSPSIFSRPINVKLSDPIVTPNKDNQKMPFWRSRIITLYIDWAKTFETFRKLPYSDKVALITNHASSYMIMCEAFRTPELIPDDKMIVGIERIAEKLPREQRHYFCNFYGNDFDARTENSSSSTNNLPSTSSSPDSFATSTSQMSNNNIHAFFDPRLIRDGNNCLQTGVRSVVDVPPTVHYPTVGCLSGLTPVMAAMIDCVMKPFRRLNISTTDTESLDAASQRNVCAEQKKMISAFYTHICHFHDSAEAQKRFSSILLRIPMIRKVAAKKNESLQIIDLFNLFTLNSLVKETTLGIK
uniref:Nuclear receptor domain-containing protein n=1 Tax=Meloidogyne hapla TaxID=6305 RepID=A0A1I8BNC8_MELHA